jgi:hypothetical protein
MSTQNKSQNKSLIYLGKTRRERKKDRVHISPIPTEAGRRFSPEKDVIVIVRTPDPLTLPLPFHIVSIVKQWVFKDRIDENGLRGEIGFLAYEYLNPILHGLGLSSVTIAHYIVNKLLMERRKARISRDKEVDVVKIEATGFYLWPHRDITERIVFEAELYDLDDHFDYNVYSYAEFIVDLYNLMRDLKIRWDIDWRY